MLNTVSVTNFRNDIFNYIDLAITNQKQVGIMNNKIVVGWFVPNTVNKKTTNMAINVLGGADKIRKKIRLWTEAKDAKELTNEIHRIVYGADRNGKELSPRY